MEKQTGTALGMVIAAEMIRPEDIKSTKELAIEWLMNNQDKLQQCIDFVNRTTMNQTDRNIGSGTSEKWKAVDNIGDEINKFLARHNLPPGCDSYFKLEACDNEPSIYVIVDKDQAVFFENYIDAVRKYFKREWTDPEYGLLTTRKKIRKRINSLYKIQYIYPSKELPNYHMKPLVTNDHPKTYHYINSMLGRESLCGFTFVPATTNEEGKVTSLKNSPTMGAINNLEDASKNGAILMPFMEFIWQMDTAMCDLMDLTKWMSLKDKLFNWRSYRIMEFFIDTYDKCFPMAGDGVSPVKTTS